MPRTYKALRPLALPSSLTARPTSQVAAGETFTVDDLAWLATGRYLRNRLVLGDLEEVTPATSDADQPGAKES